MGFLLSKAAATHTPAGPIDPEGNGHLLRGAEKSKAGPVTRIFQDAKKIKLEDIKQEHYTGKEGADTRRCSMGFVKENDGLIVTDLE